MSNVLQVSAPRPPLLLAGRSEAVSDALTHKQELFCQYYTQNEVTCCNGVLSYAEAYGFDLGNMSREPTFSEDGKNIIRDSEFQLAYQYCGFASSRMLKNDKISKRVTELFNEMLRDDVVDAQLFRIITQAPKMSDRVAAIKEYNALKQRITKKFDLTTKGESLNSEERIKIDQALDKVL